MDLSDYEWHYFIGGNCGLQHRKLPYHIAYIYHLEQGIFEAVLNREKNWMAGGIDPFSLGIFDSPDEAQRIIETTLTNLQEDVCITD